MSAFLANDILRLWRTFCVNYEARTAKDPPEAKAKRKLKNYKLKHSRLLTCYSALLYLLAISRARGTVGPEQATAMIGITPTERLERLRVEAALSEAHDIDELLERYERFLQVTNADEHTLIELFLNKDASRAYLAQAYEFGDLMYAILNTIGQHSKFHRLLVV